MVGRSIINAGFALPRDAGPHREKSDCGTRFRGPGGSAVPSVLHHPSAWQFPLLTPAHRFPGGAGDDVPRRRHRSRFLEHGAGGITTDLAEGGDRRGLGPVAGVVSETLDQKLGARGAAQPGERRSPHVGLRVRGGRRPEHASASSPSSGSSPAIAA